MAAGLLGAALTVGASPVYAAPAGGPTVEFSGGSVLNLLVCKSAPSSTQMNIPAESRVSFVNRLGQQATLKVDGKAVSQVGPNQAVPVVFHYGPVNVSMTFSCGVGVAEDFKSVGVSVSQPVAPAAQRTTTRPAAGPVAAQNGGTPGSTAKATKAANGTAAGATGRTATTGPSADAEGTATEPIDPALLDPNATVPSAMAALPGTGASTDAVYVEPAVAASGTPRNGPAGLLALVAAVCVVGVGMAAIRAIIAQRSTRTSLA